MCIEIEIDYFENSSHITDTIITLNEFSFIESQIITVSPAGNQTVPAGSDVNITYTCNVPAGFIVEWVFGNVQLSPGSSNAQLLANNGLILDPPTEGRMTNIIVTRLGREGLGSNIQLRCSALQQSPVGIMFGDNYYVRTFGEYMICVLSGTYSVITALYCMLAGPVVQVYIIKLLCKSVCTSLLCDTYAACNL